MKNLFKKVILGTSASSVQALVEGPAFVITLFAFSFLLFATPVKAQNLDSLNNIWLNKNLPDTVRFQAYANYIYESSLNSKAPDHKTALLLANQMKEEAKQSNSLFGLGISCAMIAESHSLSGKYDEAENAIIQSISFYEKIKNKRKLGLMYLKLGYVYKAIDKDSLAIVAFENSNAYKQNVSNYLVIGNIYFAQNKYYKALKEFKIVMELSIENKNVADFDKSFYNIKKVYEANLKYDQLLGLYQKAIDFYEINGSNGQLGNIYRDLGILYLDQKLFDEALSYNKKSIAIYLTVKDYFNIGTPLFNIGEMYLRFGKTDSALIYFKKVLEYDLQNQSMWGLGYSYGAIGEIYLLKNDFDEAQKNFEKSLDCRIKKGLENEIAKTELLLSKLNFKKNNLALAEKFAKKAYETHLKENDFLEIQNSASVLKNIYKKKNEGIKALEMYEMEIKMRDSLKNEDFLKAATKEKSRLEFEKQQLLAQYQEKEAARIEAEKIEQRNTLQYSGIGVGVFLLFGLVFFLGRIQLPKWAIELSVFLPFLIFFEFLLVITDSKVDAWSGGEPAVKLLLNVVMAAAIFPLHSFFERFLKQRLFYNS